MAATAISLFSGCGGSDLGLALSGARVVWANDIWRPATDIYRLNFPDTEVVCADIRGIHSFPSADLLVGCYPCQGFSQGGKRDPDAEINSLYLEFSRVLGLMRPKAFIVENVNGMRFGRNRSILEKQLESFRLKGYDVEWKMLDGRDFGLAQERKRVFIVGFQSQMNVEFQFPKATFGKDAERPWRSQREVLTGFEDWPNGEFDDQPLSWYYMSRRRRRDWDETAPCVVASSRQVALHPISPPMEYVETDKYKFTTTAPARRYSYKECAALQGFPPTFKWGERSLAMKYRAIGNAVPPPLFKEVSASVLKLIKS